MSERGRTIDVVHNRGAHRFEAAVDGQLATAEYDLQGRTIFFTHTAVPSARRHEGIAGKLARAALEYARAEGFAVVPLCPFFRAFIERHAEYRDLVRKTW